MIMKSFLFSCISFLFFIFSVGICFADAEINMTLREQIQKAKAGDFVVLAQGKNHVLLHINQRNDQEIFFEEITIPTASIVRISNWKTWVFQGAEFHTSWILYKINLTNGNLEKAYSVTKKSWLDSSNGSWFLPKLLKLNLKLIPEEKRRKAGLAPIGDSPDFRKVWNPKMFFNGKEIIKVNFHAYKTFWPVDQSELSGKMIEVYLPAETGEFPTYFPYWIQVTGKVGKIAVRVVDSGVDLISPFQSFSKFNSLFK